MTCRPSGDQCSGHRSPSWSNNNSTSLLPRDFRNKSFEPFRPVSPRKIPSTLYSNDLRRS